MRKHTKIWLKDTNSKIGKEVRYRPVTGKYSKHEESNENGRILIEEKSLVIKSTDF